MKLKYTLAALAATTLASNAAITVVRDATAFSGIHDDANEIHNGTSFINNWSAAGGGAGTNPTGNGVEVTTSGAGPNGWIQQTAGPTNTYGATDGWTLEVTTTFDANDAIALWVDGSNGGNGALVYVGANGIGDGGNGTGTNQSVSTDSNIGLHTFRLAYDTATGNINIWRDAVLVTDTFAASNPGGGPRLIIGDCCSGGAGITTDGFTIHKVAFDNTGGFAPTPEPSSTALLGLGGLALILRRRK